MEREIVFRYNTPSADKVLLAGWLVGALLLSGLFLFLMRWTGVTGVLLLSMTLQQQAGLFLLHLLGVLICIVLGFFLALPAAVYAGERTGRARFSGETVVLELGRRRETTRSQIGRVDYTRQTLLGRTTPLLLYSLRVETERETVALRTSRLEALEKKRWKWGRNRDDSTLRALHQELARFVSEGEET